MKQPSLFAHIRDIFLLPVNVTIVIPWLIHDRDQHLIPNNFVIKLMGGLLLVAGLALFSTSVFLFHRVGRGTLAPWQSTQKLVISGPYRYCRNPMISGVFFMLMGESLLFHSTNILIWTGLFFMINTFYFILSEEPSLEKRFGNDYRVYKSHVSRWIPRLTPYRGE